MKIDISQKRHIAKAITWRIIASLTSFSITFFVFQDHPDVWALAGGMAAAESVIKMVLYYFHERVWYKSSFGVNHKRDGEE